MPLKGHLKTFQKRIKKHRNTAFYRVADMVLFDKKHRCIFLCLKGDGEAMDEKLTREVLDRLVTIEAKLTLITIEHPVCQKQVNDHSVEIAETKSSVKSAHKRIDDMSNRIYKTVGISATLVGIFASVLTWALSR